MLKKIILNIALVVVTVFVLDFVIGKLLHHYYFTEFSGSHQRTTYSMEQTKADILIFGSSRANHHYVPKIFEDSLKLTCYNTGRDANGIFFQAALINSVLKRYTPKVIILDFSGGFAKSSDSYDNISSLLPYYDNHTEIRDIIKLKSDFENVKLVSKIYPFNSQVLAIVMGNMEMNRYRYPDEKGYVALYNKIPNQADIADEPEIVELKPDSNKINAMRSFVQQAKASGAQIYVIYSPYYQDHSKDPDIAMCDELCKKENVTFLNFSMDPQFVKNKDLFYDEVHLNDSGAKVLSIKLTEKIKTGLSFYK
jgi:hypothetical protein